MSWAQLAVHVTVSVAVLLVAVTVMLMVFHRVRRYSKRQAKKLAVINRVRAQYGKDGYGN